MASRTRSAQHSPALPAWSGPVARIHRRARSRNGPGGDTFRAGASRQPSWGPWSARSRASLRSAAPGKADQAPSRGPRRRPTRSAPQHRSIKLVIWIHPPGGLLERSNTRTTRRACQAAQRRVRTTPWPTDPTMDDVAAAAGVVAGARVARQRAGRRGSVTVHERLSASAPNDSATGPTSPPANSPVGAHRRSACCSTISTTPGSPRSPTGFTDAAEGAGYQIIIANGRRSAATEDCRRVVPRPSCGRHDPRRVSPFPAGRIDGLGAKTAVVSVGRALRSSRADTVNTDERLGSELVVRHLAGLGHRDGSCTSTAGSARGATRRRAGCAMEEADSPTGQR